MCVKDIFSIYTGNIGNSYIFPITEGPGLGPGRFRRFKTVVSSFAGAAAASQQEHRLRGGHAEAERRAEGLVGSIPGIQGDWVPKMVPGLVMGKP